MISPVGFGIRPQFGHSTKAWIRAGTVLYSVRELIGIPVALLDACTRKEIKRGGHPLVTIGIQLNRLDELGAVILRAVDARAYRVSHHEFRGIGL